MTPEEALETLRQSIATAKEDAKRGAEWAAMSLKRELDELGRKSSERIATLERENERLYRDAREAKKALAINESIERHKGKIRHIPGRNEIVRTKYTDQGIGIAERVYLRHWRKENKRVRGTNGGFGLLELLMSNDPNSRPAAISQRDATVAATVIQWLGTNCGRCFMHECEQESRKLHDAFYAKERKRINQRKDGGK